MKRLVYYLTDITKVVAIILLYQLPASLKISIYNTLMKFIRMEAKIKGFSKYRKKLVNRITYLVKLKY